MSEVLLNDFNKLDGLQMFNIDSAGLNMNEVIDISIDTRTIVSGQTYLAIRGERLDGHQFVDQAFTKGARLAMVDREYFETAKSDHALAVSVDTIKTLQMLAANHRQKYNFPVIGITGSNGKTTTKEMIAHVLGQKYKVHKNSGNFNNHIGCPLTLLGLDSSHRAAVIEMGTNHPGEIAVLGEMVRPDHGLITNIGAAHLEFFGNKEEVFREKQSLFDYTRSDGALYINLDDPFLAKFHRQDCKTITFSLESEADVRGKIKKINGDGCAVFLMNDKIEITLRVPGIHNASNALAAVAVALQLGMADSEIRDGLESFRSYDKRLQIIEQNGVKYINDAYNSNPDSVKAVLETVSQIETAGKKIYVLADMYELGENSRAEHQNVIRMALDKNPDILLLMGKLMQEAGQKFHDYRIHRFLEHMEASDFLSENLMAGDLILLKGSRGMAMEKILSLLGVNENNLNN